MHSISNIIYGQKLKNDHQWRKLDSLIDWLSVIPCNDISFYIEFPAYIGVQFNTKMGTKPIDTIASELSDDIRHEYSRLITQAVDNILEELSMLFDEEEISQEEYDELRKEVNLLLSNKPQLMAVQSQR